jgi:hypothetical protein
MFEREHVTDALRFWELGRIPFNLVLAAIVAGTIWASGVGWYAVVWMAPALFVLAALANLLYCAAYPVDLFVQASAYRESWRGMRWLLWALGTALASVFAAMTMIGVQPFGLGPVVIWR